MGETLLPFTVILAHLALLKRPLFTIQIKDIEMKPFGCLEKHMLHKFAFNSNSALSILKDTGSLGLNQDSSAYLPI